MEGKTFPRRKLLVALLFLYCDQFSQRLYIVLCAFFTLSQIGVNVDRSNKNVIAIVEFCGKICNGLSLIAGCPF